MCRNNRKHMKSRRIINYKTDGGGHDDIYLCMDNLERWGRLSREEKLALQLRQVEWVLFQASLQGLAINPDSLRAVVEVRRSLDTGWGYTDAMANVKVLADQAFEAAGDNRLLSNQKKLNRKILSYMCFALANNTYYCLGDDGANIFTSFSDVDTVYLRPLGGLKSKSPIALWLKTESVEL